MKAFFKKWWQGLLYEPEDPRKLAGSKIKIAAIGGGTGLAMLISGLKKYSGDISAIVTVTDDGASSGTLRKDFDILPPGDIRKCISALAYDEKLISNLMEYRFSGGGKSLGNHSLGNIWLTALTKYFGSFERAVEATTEIFETAGKVLPASLQNIKLCAEYTDGTKICGESKIPKARKSIKKVYLNKTGVRPYKKAVLAIENADLIIIGPGSLFTSVLPNLLIAGIRNAIAKNKKAVRVFVCNSSTERGETENLTVEDHIAAINSHTKTKLFNYCVVNNKTLKKSQKTFALGEINNITTNEKEILGCKIVTADVVNNKNPLYHDSEKLAKVLIELYNGSKK